jgi:hypothetical protein
MSGYDVIGDIHGYAAPLEALLQKMGYTRSGRGYRAPPGRKAVFVGDLIDRGPEQMRVVERVRAMVDDGQALCVLGNHEYNAVRAVTRRRDVAGNELPEDAPDAWLLPQIPDKRGVSAEFLAQVGENSDVHKEMISWFRTLPVMLDLGGIRVVHAWWNDAHADFLGARLQNGLDDAFLQAAAVKGSPERAAIAGATKGLELQLPDGLKFRNHDGSLQRAPRIRWWLPRGSSWHEAAFVPADCRELLLDKPMPDCEGFGEVEGTPVFIGHYWMDGLPAPQSPKVACCDYSVPKRGSLVAYRWDGETNLTERNFVESG